MRNCFVPWCDTICKKLPKRMMFLPPRKKEEFEMWKKVLPKRREFKPSDKVCERHFNKEDIITTFDHMINGKLFQMDRGRPKLKPTAVPCLNLPTKEDELLYLKKRRGRVNTIYDFDEQSLHEPKEMLIMHIGDNDFIKEELVETEPEYQFDETDITTVEIVEEERMTPSMGHVYARSDKITAIQVDVQALYDILYDDIFEVVLPSTLWGQVRDSERTFISFVYFDRELLKVSKYITLESNGNLKIFLHSRLISEQMLTCEITHEDISQIIAQVDELPICKNFVETNNCEIRATEGSLYCNLCRNYI